MAHGKLDENVHFQHTENLLVSLSRHCKPIHLQVNFILIVGNTDFPYLSPTLLKVFFSAQIRKSITWCFFFAGVPDWTPQFTAYGCERAFRDNSHLLSRRSFVILLLICFCSENKRRQEEKMMEWDIWQSWDLTGYFLQKGREEAGKEKSSCKLTYCSVSNYTFRKIFVKIRGYHWFRSKWHCLPLFGKFRLQLNMLSWKHWWCAKFSI